MKRCCYVIIRSDRRSPCMRVVCSLPDTPRTCHSSSCDARMFPSSPSPGSAAVRVISSLSWYGSSTQSSNAWSPKYYLTHLCLEWPAPTVTRADRPIAQTIEVPLACETVTLCVLTNLKQKLTLMCIFTSQMWWTPLEDCCLPDPFVWSPKIA